MDGSPLVVRNNDSGAFLVVQWLRFHTPNAGGPGSIPGGGTKSHMPQLSVHMLQIKKPSAAMKTEYSQIKNK